MGRQCSFLGQCESAGLASEISIKPLHPAVPVPLSTERALRLSAASPGTRTCSQAHPWSSANTLGGPGLVLVNRGHGWWNHISVVPGYCEPEFILQFMWKITAKPQGVKARAQVTVHTRGLTGSAPISVDTRGLPGHCSTVMALCDLKASLSAHSEPKD